MLIANDSDIKTLAWAKMNDLIPAIVQDNFSGRVLMQGFMNSAAMQKTLDTGKVTFWSRSQQSLWTKGETSGNYLELASIHSDCDNDSLLILAQPCGPTCHTGSDSCFDTETQASPELAFLDSLEQLIGQRQTEMPVNSYTTDLFNAGTNRIAQKVGEEGVETALAAVVGDDNELLNESADLIFHLIVLLRQRKLRLADLIHTLKSRQG